MGDKDVRTAYRRVLKYCKNPAKVAAPAPIKVCPWCGRPFTENRFACAGVEGAISRLDRHYGGTVRGLNPGVETTNPDFSGDGIGESQEAMTSERSIPYDADDEHEMHMT